MEGSVLNRALGILILVSGLGLNACQPIAPLIPAKPSGEAIESATPSARAIQSPSPSEATQDSPVELREAIAPDEVNQIEPLSEQDLYDPLAIIRELGQAKDSPEIIPDEALATRESLDQLSGPTVFPRPPVDDLSAGTPKELGEQELPTAVAPPPEPVATESAIWTTLRAGFQLPALPSNREASGHIRGLIDNPDALAEFLNKGTLYLPFVLAEVQKRNMPLEVALLPYVESGYSPWAVSPMGAMGMWQIMPGTARSLDLKRDNTCDQRRDLIESTRAGLDYLEQLAKRFDGDWMLALAAYNAGPGRVERAVQANRAKKQPVDLWSLKLPRETTRYVPRLLALRDLIRNADELSVQLPTIPSELHFTTVFLEAPMEVSLAAELSQVSIDEIRRLNPCIRSWITPSHQPYTLLLPNEAAGGFAARLVSVSVRDYVRTRPYRIATGDTLSGIAKKVGATVDELKILNGMQSTRIIAGQTLRVPNTGEMVNAVIASSEGGPGDSFRYKVRSGDSLWEIARRFNTTVNTLRDLNNASTLIRPGQWLTVPLN